MEVKGRSKWVEMGVKVCVLKVQRWRENGGQHTCIRTHTCTRTCKHMIYTHTHTYAHTHMYTRTARSSICPMTARLRTSWAESHSCPSSGHVPPSRISSSMQPRQNVWPHLTEMTGLAEHALAGRADQGRRLVHKLGRFGGHLSAAGEEGGPASGSGGPREEWRGRGSSLRPHPQCPPAEGESALIGLGLSAAVWNLGTKHAPRPLWCHAPAFTPPFHSRNAPFSCSLRCHGLDFKTSLILLPAYAAGSMRAPLYSSAQNSLQSELQRVNNE